MDMRFFYDDVHDTFTNTILLKRVGELHLPILILPLFIFPCNLSGLWLQPVISSNRCVVFTTSRPSRPSRRSHSRPSRRGPSRPSRPSHSRCHSRPSRPIRASPSRPSRDPSPSRPTRRRPPVVQGPGAAARKALIWLISSYISSNPYLILLQTIRTIDIDKLFSSVY